MAFSKPVINTQLKMGVPYVSLNGKTGITVPPGDVDALAEAMNTLANDPKLRKHTAKPAMNACAANFPNSA